jgi:hypothetical protein
VGSNVTGEIGRFLSKTKRDTNLNTNWPHVKIFVSASNLETNTNFEYRFERDPYLDHVF